MPDVLSNIVMGFGVALTWQNIGLCFFGCLVGTAIGVLPGIGPLTTMAMILPVTFWIPPVGALICWPACSTVRNMAARPPPSWSRFPARRHRSSLSSMVMPWRQRGRAGPALALPRSGLCRGLVVTLVIAIGGPPLAKVALLFQSADYVSSWCSGWYRRSCSPMARAQAVGMIVLGVMLGLVGTDVSTGEYRMTMGLDVLYDGIGFVAAVDGPVRLAEIMVNLESGSVTDMQAKAVTGLWPTLTISCNRFPPWCAAPRSVPHSESSRAAGRPSRRSRPTAGEKVSRTRSASATAPSRRGRPGIR